MNHPCPRYEPELSAYLDGETPPALRTEIETHLRVCAACRAAVGQLRSVSRTLHRWDAHETRYATTTGFRNRVFAEVGAEGVAPRTDTLWRIAAGVALVVTGAGAWALVAPRLRPSGNDGVAELSAAVAKLDGLVRSRAAPAADRTALPRDPAIERVEPPGPVVARASESDGPAAPPQMPEAWEQRGDERFLREALRDHDAFNRERRILALEEQVNRLRQSSESASQRATSAPPAPSSLAAFLGEVRVATSNYPSFEEVQVWPIELPGARAGDPSRSIPCGDAISQEILSVTEPVRETVVAVNSDAKRPVLVLAGDVLAGSRQDRVARQDVLVAPGQRVSIPTYTCGRERRTSYRTFRHSDGVAMPELRALIAADRAFLSGGLDQDVFDEFVGRTVGALASPNDRGSLDNLFRNLQLVTQVDRKVKNFMKRLDGPSVVGFAVSAGGQVLGVEIFGDHATMLDHRSRVLGSYVMSAIAIDHIVGEPPTREAVASVVAAASRGAFHAETATGSGTLSVFRGVDGGAFGFGLLDGTRVVHAVLFTSMPPGVGAPGTRGGHRGPGDATPPIDPGRGGTSPGRGDDAGGDGVEPK